MPRNLFSVKQRALRKELMMPLRRNGEPKLRNSSPGRAVSQNGRPFRGRAYFSLGVRPDRV